MTSENEEDFGRYQLLIMDRLNELRLTQADVVVHLSKIDTEIALLKLKSSFWGAVAGLSAYVITWGVQYLMRKP
jgi:hypothetical protein